MLKKVFYLLFLTSLLFSCKLIGTKTPPVPEAVLAEEPQQVFNLTLLACGDNLFHAPIIRTYKQGDIYDFSPIYAPVKSIVENADLAFINQETVMGGEKFGYSGYPAFNTPQSLAQTIADSGFDIVNQANNHVMDMGKNGLVATLDLWDTIPEITVIGARKGEEKRTIIVKNNISLGFLSYTHSLNGIPLPKDSPNLVSMNNREKMAKDIEDLRPLCDFLIVSMHWGDEYNLVEPGSDQKAQARFLADHNVDLIIGHHPHVLQRVEILKRADGKDTLCFYSLGNFVSNQTEKDRLLGGLMAVTFTRDISKTPVELTISDSGMVPVVTHYEQGFINTTVYPLYSYNDELLKKHLHITKDKEFTINYLYSLIKRLNTKIIMHNPYKKEEDNG